LLVEERRIVESIAGNENLEIQWRLATLKEAKEVVTQYHKYLSENSLIKIVAETDGTAAAGGSFTSNKLAGRNSERQIPYSNRRSEEG
jgi:hypothetical protein